MHHKIFNSISYFYPLDTISATVTVITIKTDSRHDHLSLWGQNNSWLRTTDIRRISTHINKAFTWYSPGLKACFRNEHNT